MAYPQLAENLFAPVEYYMSSGGKRIRPAMCLMACDLLGGKVEEALPAALAVEVFHNFTLLHDDVMDDAPIRRGKPSAHVRWNINQALLSGDAMLVYAYQLLAKVPEQHLLKATEIFSRTALDVCEGQQLDMDFETQDDVELDLYLEMIRLKTSALLNGSMQLGALIAGASEKDREAIGIFGESLGMAFQLMDDYLDAFGGTDFGKVQGGDIIADKKTYLAIRTRQKADAPTRQDYDTSMAERDPDKKVEAVTGIMRKVGADVDLLSLTSQYSDTAIELLNNIDVADDRKEVLRGLTHMLLRRTT